MQPTPTQTFIYLDKLGHLYKPGTDSLVLVNNTRRRLNDTKDTKHFLFPIAAQIKI
jgi:hypothetical protein